jgi:aspartate/methionine/tyrosine aminotransferase
MLTSSSVSANIRNTDYAIRGPLLKRAKKISADLKAGKGSYAFDNVLFCHNGNPQAHGQPPLTFPREVLACVTNPNLLKSEGLFAPDVIERARTTIEAQKQLGFSTGSYSDSQGYRSVRKNVAEFIEARDDSTTIHVDPDNIFLNSATRNAMHLIRSLLGGSIDEGIMLPVPHYPLYSAAVALQNGTTAPYFLDEAHGWAVSTAELEQSYSAAKTMGVKMQALVAINPGNPTGNVMSPAAMREVIDFCHKKKLLLIADEVYQDNVYDKQFHSFREVLLTTPHRNEVQLASLHSVSKGMFGECGLRGGYLHMMNVDSRTMDQFKKLPAVNLCPNVGGQVMLDLMVKQPEAGDASYKTFRKEYDAIYQSYRKRAKLMAKSFNKVPGMSCSPVHGAMYAFPRLHLNDRFVAHSLAESVDPDMKWCRMLLEKEGVLVIPGSGFGQQAGTYHFRSIFNGALDAEEVLARISRFQENFDGKA